jgi:hypothetical protein
MEAKRWGAIVIEDSPADPLIGQCGVIGRIYPRI